MEIPWGVLKLLPGGLGNCNEASGLISQREELLVLHKDEHVLGRKPSVCDFVLKFPYVSAKHCSIRRLADDHENESPVRVTITDYSTNGTFINGKLIGKNNASTANVGDTISLTNPNRKKQSAVPHHAYVLEVFLPSARSQDVPVGEKLNFQKRGNGGPAESPRSPKRSKSAANGALETLQSSNQELRHKLASAERRAQQLEIKCGAQGDQLQEATQKMQLQEESLSKLTTQVKEWKEKYAQSRVELEEKRGTSAAVQRQLEESKEKTEYLMKTAEEAEALISMLQKSKTAADSALEGLQKTLEESRLEVQRLNAAISQQAHDCSELRQQNKALKTAQTKEEQHRADLQQRLEAVVAEREVLQRQNDLAQAELLSVKAQADSLSSAARNKQELEKQLNLAKEDTSRYHELYTQSRGSLAEERRLLAETRENLRLIENKLGQDKELNQQLQSQAQDLRAQVDSLKDRLNGSEKMNLDLRESNQRLTSKLQEEVADKNAVADQLSFCEERSLMLHSRLEHALSSFSRIKSKFVHIVAAMEDVDMSMPITPNRRNLTELTSQASATDDEEPAPTQLDYMHPKQFPSSAIATEPIEDTLLATQVIPSSTASTSPLITSTPQSANIKSFTLKRQELLPIVEEFENEKWNEAVEAEDETALTEVQHAPQQLPIKLASASIKGERLPNAFTESLDTEGSRRPDGNDKAEVMEQSEESQVGAQAVESLFDGGTLPEQFAQVDHIENCADMETQDDNYSAQFR